MSPAQAFQKHSAIGERPVRSAVVESEGRDQFGQPIAAVPWQEALEDWDRALELKACSESDSLRGGIQKALIELRVVGQGDVGVGEVMDIPEGLIE